MDNATEQDTEARTRPASDPRLTICLIGPKSAGKSSLIETFVDCLSVEKSHGFPRSHHIAVMDVAEKDFRTETEIPVRILGEETGNYALGRRRFFTRQQATTDTLSYCFKLDSTEPGRGQQTYFLRVVDSAGEMAVREGHGAAVERDATQLKELRDALVIADAVIFVVPYVDFGVAAWHSDLRLIIDQLHQPAMKAKTVVVAFSQYERLFVNFGNEAFAFACQTRLMREMIRRALGEVHWTDNLRNLQQQKGVDVYFTAVSAYGFVKRRGNPNIDPGEGQDDGTDQMFGKYQAKETGNETRDINRYWRPFLTAEPFLCAVLQRKSAYSFTFADLDDEFVRSELSSWETPISQTPTQERPSGLVLSLGKFSRSVIKFFDRGSRE